MKIGFKKIFALASIAMLCSAMTTLQGLGGTAIDNKEKPSADRQRSIVIYYDNDVHCAYEGYDRMTSLRTLTQDTAWVALVSCGDFVQGGPAGTLSRGGYIYDIMRTMDYDAVTIGNHEFDFGVPRQFELLGDASLNHGEASVLPVTCVNFTYGEERTRFYPEYIMRSYGDKKVAFVGVTTTGPEYSYAHAFGTPEASEKHYTLNQETLYTLVQQGVDHAREAGADYVVVLSHLGESSAAGVNSHSLVATTRHIDAVLDGHTHSIVPCTYVSDLDGRQVPISQTGTQFAHIGKMVIAPDGHVTLGLVDTKTVEPIHSVTTDSIHSVTAKMEAVVSARVATTDFEFLSTDGQSKWPVRSEETNAGDLVADAFRDFSGAEIAIMNGGGYRKSLPAGELNYGHVLAMLPYDEHLEVVEVKGERIELLLDKCSAQVPTPSGKFAQVSGLRYTIDTTSGNKVKDIEVLDPTTDSYAPLDPERTYRLCTTSYGIGGGGMYGVLSTCPIVQTFDEGCTHLVADYLRKLQREGTISRYRQPEGRITIK